MLSLACASSPWPDEPGVPVALSRAANVDAGDSFLAALTTTRQAQDLPAPMVTPRYQSEMSTLAEDLQSGKTSVAGARRAIEAWGGATYHHAVKTWIVDCGKGTPQVPSALGELPTAVVSYAAAHFRPRSLAADQCVVLVVVPTSAGEPVRAIAAK
ncbi:MAG TPA: hypothetical protein VGP64_01880 [Polyangia bacterium]